MQGGFGNYISSEAKKGAIPLNQNSPQKAPLNLYAEQLSGSAFTQPRNENKKSWLYRRLPSAGHSDLKEYTHSDFQTPPFGVKTPPTQFRWDPLKVRDVDFLDSISTIAGNGSPHSGSGFTTHLYSFTKPMVDRYFFNSDGHFIFVPYEGTIEIFTEFGRLQIEPTEIAVVPKGIKFKVNALGNSARGYLGENYGHPFVIPDLGPIGANGLANPRHFFAPDAEIEENHKDCTIIQKFGGNLWQYRQDHSPLDVVGWHGDYWPYKYDLKLFNTINTVSFDHPDPSIFTVLTSPSGHPGLANIDFVIFPPRWMVAEDTFRPPYYHRNMMSEYMGLIQGQYDAKADGFVPEAEVFITLLARTAQMQRRSMMR